MNFRKLLFATAGSGVLSCAAVAADSPVRLVTLDPGHFHAGLVQKMMYPDVDPVVRVYARGGAELQEHLARVESYNQRAENPTRWQENVYTGDDFLERMLEDKAGNVVIIAGNNARKTEYISKSIGAGFNVLADKPMAITPAGFTELRKAFALAEKENVLLYDIMTERSEITSILQRELARFPALFGELEKGSPGYPSVEKESVHHFFKEVSGKPLVRPAWFYDVDQQGEAVTDVSTHLVDLVQWGCFPNQTLNWRKDVKVIEATRWATRLTAEEFKRSTGLPEFPAYLKKDVDSDGRLNVYQNGEILFALKGVHAKVRVKWNFQAPPGSQDTHYSMMRGTRALLEIKQGPQQKYKPTLYVANRSSSSPEQFENHLRAALQRLNATWPGLGVMPAGKAWEIVIPAKYSVGHEAHFAEVTERFLEYLKAGRLPSWEVPNMLAKYHTTTEAYRLARKR